MVASHVTRTPCTIFFHDFVTVEAVKSSNMILIAQALTSECDSTHLR